MSNTNKTVGEMTWQDTVLFDPNKGSQKKDEWMRFKEGSNIIRVLTLPHQYFQHNILIDGGKKYGYRVNCSNTKDSSCPLCDKGEKPKRRWLLGVIDRETNMYKILDVSFSVFKAIHNLQSDSDWGDPTTYDISIISNSQLGPNRYSAVAKPKKPLSATDLAIQAEHGTDALVRRSTPPTFEQVQARLDRINEEISGSAGGSSKSSDEADDTSDEGNDNFFQDYSAKKSA